MPFTTEYKKLMLIGRGSFAAVYKVRHRKLGYVRAIKISNEMVDNESDKAYQSFLNECKLLLQIGNGCHPNIVHIYQPRLINSHAIVEMDYIDGQTLNEYLREQKFINIDEFWRFAEGIAGAVGYCHADLYKFLMDPDTDNLEMDPEDGSKFIITPEKERELKARYCVNHNDLHSNNIMRRNYDGNFILLDFGLAIQKEHCVKSSSRGDGAYEYSSPEKLDGKEITAASDVYSLGILLYEVLAGRVPFVMETGGGMADISRIYDRQLHEKPAPIEPLRRAAFESVFPGKKYGKDYPDELEEVIMKCLEKNPADRYPDAKQVLEALRRVKTLMRPADGASAEIIEQLKLENAKLRDEIKSLKASGRSSGTIRIGDVMNGGRVCHIDSSGSHGLILVKVSQPMPWLRRIDEEDYDRMGPQSRLWYESNCFIVPRGTRMPSAAELREIAPSARELGLTSPIWITDSGDDRQKAFSLSFGREIPASGMSNLFLAVKSF